MAGPLATTWLQRSDAAAAGITGAGALLLHWDAFGERLGIAAPEPAVTAVAAAALAWAPLLWLLAPSLLAALASAAAALAAGVALLEADATKTLGDIALVAATVQMAMSAITEIAVAFATRSKRGGRA